MKYVNVYYLSRAYGGPEEGGWWYDIYEPVAFRRVRKVEAEGVAAKLREEYPKTGNAGRMSGGADYRVFIEDEVAASYDTYAPWC